MLALLDKGEQEFGAAARDRYAALIVQAMQDVADNPRRPGSKSDPRVDTTVLFYHIRHSRDRVVDPPGRVRKPGHILVYGQAEHGVVDIFSLIPDVIPTDVAVRQFLPEL